MPKPMIPIWEKAVLSVEEAAAYGNISHQIIRGHALLAKIGKSTFPAFWVGDTLKVHREEFNEWLKEVAVGHQKLEIKTVTEMLKQVTEIKRGRPRKGRAVNDHETQVFKMQ